MVTEPDDSVLCALLLRWLEWHVDGFGHHLDSIPLSVWAASNVVMQEQNGVSGEATTLAHEEARLRLELARAALLDAATEVACTWAGTGALMPDEVHALVALYRANNEWQEAQLQAFAPHEAEGLVEIAQKQEAA